MANRYSIAEARNNLASLVHQAEQGEPVELTRRGRPVAVLVSLAEYERLAGGGPSFAERLAAFRDARRLDRTGVEGVFDAVRDRSPGRKVRL